MYFVLCYLAGALTIISPCILPVLPFVFANGARPFLRNGLPLFAGLALTFALVASAAADLPPGTVLVVVHTGGGRAKALANDLRSLGAAVHPCARLTKVSERVDFIRKEFRASGVRVDEDTVTALLDAIGSDVRELASASSQLVADTGGEVDAAAVRRYHSGKAEVKGFDIADKAVSVITANARTGQIGDGKIFVTPIDHALRIRTGETDSDAL